MKGLGQLFLQSSASGQETLARGIPVLKDATSGLKLLAITTSSGAAHIKSKSAQPWTCHGHLIVNLLHLHGAHGAHSNVNGAISRSAHYTHVLQHPGWEIKECEVKTRGTRYPERGSSIAPSWEGWKMCKDYTYVM